MKKTQILEFLIKSYGLIPKEVSHYKTESFGGQFQVATGWKGIGVNENGDAIIRFHEPDGFDMAVYEILRQAKREGLTPKYTKLT